MIHLYFSELAGPLPAAAYHESLKLLPQGLQQAIEQKKRWQDAHTSLLGKTMLLEALKTYGDYTLEDLHCNAFGRPQLDPPVDFSISHSENAVICALSTHRIGIDLEKIQPIEFHDFERFFSPEEWEEIRESASPLQDFYKLWTQKEAVIKAVGEGLSLLTEVRVNGRYAECRGERWHLASIDLGPDYAACVASKQELKWQLKVNLQEVQESEAKELCR